MSNQEPSGLGTLSTVVGMSTKAWAVAKGALPTACRWMVGADAVFDLKLRQDVAAVYVDQLRQVLKEQGDTREQLRSNPRNLSAQNHLQWLQEEEQLAIKKIAAIQYAAESLAGDIEPERELEQHWVDTFEVHARRRTEPWRSQLLSRALAYEATSPGTISLKALWLMGTVEREVFDFLEAFLNTGYICENLSRGGRTFVVRTNLLPGEEHQFSNSPVPVGDEGRLCNLWMVYTRLAEEGLAAPLSAQGEYGVGCCRLTYGNRVTYHAASSSQYGMTDGYTLTAVGSQLELLCVRKTNELGDRIFNDETTYGHETMRALLERRLETAEKRQSKGKDAWPVTHIQFLLAAFARQFGDPDYLAEIDDLIPRINSELKYEEDRLKELKAAKASRISRKKK